MAAVKHARKTSQRFHKSVQSISSSSLDSVRAAPLTASSSHPLPPVPPLPTTPLDGVHALARKRWTTFDHLARVYTGAGTTPYLGSVCVSLEELHLAHDPVKLRKRSVHVYTLGKSVCAMLDIPSEDDFIMALSTLLSEYEQWVNASKSSRLMFMASQKRPDEQQFTYLRVQHVPFDLDYVQVLTTFLQGMTRVYLRIQGWTQCDASLLDSVGKVDSKLKKWIWIAVKDLDVVVKQIVRDDMSHLDPTYPVFDTWDAL